jgi:hypothetical protein
VNINTTRTHTTKKLNGGINIYGKARKSMIIKTHPARCLDGKIRLDQYRGYDCKFYIHHRVPYIWSECKKHSGKHYADCTCMNNPFKCKDFEMKERKQHEDNT